ncbi:hypothetical protein ABZ840_11085 [Streptomyces sp. NPDC047117]|uniref:hypothetical protein n=1 Tax=Streptomyces sp. NPDC047117 TaxID=3155379 RepID=UPI0033F3EA53
MAASKRTSPSKAPTNCLDCNGKGETSTAVRVGPRGKKLTDHQQAALCTTCWGTGDITRAAG